MNVDRTIALSGVVFAIATFAGLMLLLSGAAVGESTNAEAAEWLSQSAHRTRAMAGGYVMCGGAIAFMVFAAALLDRLRSAQAPGLAVGVAQIAAIAFVILTLAAAIGMASAAYAVSSSVEPTPIDPGAVRVTTYGFALWAIAGALAGATFVAAVSVAVLASRALPRWLALVGFLLAGVAVFGIAFLPTLGLLVWGVLVAIVAIARGVTAPAVDPQLSGA
jgi:hypothetical protein